MADATTEQEIIDNGNSLLNTINTLIQSNVLAVDQLTAHKTDSEAHQDIRDSIASIVTGSGFVTADTMATSISSNITTHNSNTYSHADMRTLIASNASNISSLALRVAALEGSDTSIETQVSLAIKEINDRYDPVLDALKAAWQAAVLNNTGTADAINTEYNNTLAAKNAEVLAVLQEYGYA